MQKMEETILAIDIGTTSLKAAFLQDSRKVLAQARIEFGGGRIADEWIFALESAVKSLFTQCPCAAVEAVVLSGNGPSVVAEDGESLLWNEATADFPFETKSLFIPRFFSFKQKFPKSWEKSRFVFGAAEFLIFFLTEKAVSILPSDNFKTAYWTRDELLDCGFSEIEIKKIPPFCKSGSLAGKISANAAKKTGLLEGTLVFAGAPDFISALVGTGTIFPGTLCDRAGSSEGINLCTKNPVFGEKIRTLPSVVGGLWNASVLISDSGSRKNSESMLEEFAEAVEILKKAAENAGEIFPKICAISGGQSKDEEWIQKKASTAKIAIGKPWFADAELIGDLIFARTALGDYDDLQEAAAVICGFSKIFEPQK